MHHGILAIAVVFSSAAFAAGPAAAPKAEAPVHLRAGPQTSQQLFDEIAAKDGAVFDVVFGSCDIDKLRPLIADDLEFFHDKDGLSETSGAHFIDDISRHCERIKSGEDFRARRELVAGSMKVYPLNNYGAVETGEHRFYAIADGKPDQLTESAQFLHVWKNDHGEWKLARVVSYGHALAEQNAK
jgi:hypothetical protein